jgi:hypothetical protein
MGVFSVLWSAMSQPNPNGYRQAVQVPVIDADAERRSVESEALEAILGEISGDQVAEKAAERWVASIPDPEGFESRVADRIAEKCRALASRGKKCKKGG